ncbi:phosphate ABC transporter permease subunit PstC [Actinosynnema sp. NPDC047251]|uniref:Phosphate transport system permease protein n=1 Tax=Saccharothrix espanaensis (strain ATCC 51144 / DSM 44229 / JCM 9112 / NBRC 15066 / NRRL 15764) TaxID=1179773 RepID=K0KAW2_SACES|nr:phosphate ABC transporter permease subunit PstC [Saccharothrix espanaensis]CCH35411.1 ABC-type phosphate transporter, permease subunit [Saccharothrix espanaensis DSM 44229]
MNDRTVAKRPAGTGDTGARKGVPAARSDSEAPIPPTTEAELNAPHVRPGDRIFRGLATGSGIFIVVLIGAIGLFLLIQAVPSLAQDHVNFLTSREWATGDSKNLRFGILDLLLVTVVSAAFALVIAMPIALGIALFLTQYAPRRLARPFAYVIDLLSAVPSIIYGLWGLLVLAPVLTPIGEWLTSTLGFIPLFAKGNVSIELGGTIFTAGIVLAVMILPIITAVSREVFDRTPPAHVEGAIALGATKWEVVRTTVLPFGKAGYVSASMLGLGRALGETIALMIILSATNEAFGWSLFDGGATFASKIALAAPEFNDALSAGAFIAAGLVLFALTFVVNAIARSIVAGHKEYE